MKKNELIVKYSGELNEKLDRAIERCLAEFGCTRWASGYDLVDDVRDLAFDCQEEAI